MTLDELRAATTDNPPDELVLELPDDVPGVVSDLATEVTAERHHRCRQDDRPPGLVQERVRRTHLTVQPVTATTRSRCSSRSRRGYCEQFASTFAVMARTLGIPSRVAVGFTPGRTQRRRVVQRVRQELARLAGDLVRRHRLDPVRTHAAARDSRRRERHGSRSGRAAGPVANLVTWPAWTTRSRAGRRGPSVAAIATGEVDDCRQVSGSDRILHHTRFDAIEHQLRTSEHLEPSVAQVAPREVDVAIAASALHGRSSKVAAPVLRDDVDLELPERLRHVGAHELLGFSAHLDADVDVAHLGAVRTAEHAAGQVDAVNYDSHASIVHDGT